MNQVALVPVLVVIKVDRAAEDHQKILRMVEYLLLAMVIQSIMMVLLYVLDQSL